MFSKKVPVFEPFKSKTYLKCAGARIKQLIGKKNNESKIVAKEVGALLKDSKEELARIKVEHIIRNKNDIHALEIIQLFCDLLLARHLLLESEKGCPVEMQEAVFSVCWAASRTEVPELMQVRQQFILKYPLDFGLDPRTGKPLQVLNPTAGATGAVGASALPNLEFCVNPKLKDYLSVKIPERRLVVEYLEQIAAVYAPEWEAPAWLVDAPNEHLIDVGNYVQPGQFEPGYDPGAASAPPAQPVQATVIDDFDAMFPAVPGTAPSGGAPPPKSGAPVQAYLAESEADKEAAAKAAAAAASLPNFDDLEARFAALNGGGTAAVGGSATSAVAPPAGSQLPTEEAATPLKCVCGYIFSDTGKFCSECGTKRPVSQDAAPEVPPYKANLPSADAVSADGTIQMDPVPAQVPPAADDLEARLNALNDAGPALAPPATVPHGAANTTGADTLDLEARLAALGGSTPSEPPAGDPFAGLPTPPGSLPLPPGDAGVQQNLSAGEPLDDLEARFAALRGENNLD